MPGIEEKLDRTRKRLQLYYKAEEAILTGQEYTIGSKRLRRADLSDVQAAIKTLEKEAASLEKSGRNKALRAVPLDI